MSAPTKSLEEQLADAELELECAKMIDSVQRMTAEVARCKKQIAHLKQQIVERNAQESRQ